MGLAIRADETAEPCVIIWVPEESRADEMLLDRIRREVRHAASLDHPNIVRVIGFAALEKGPARVVEFADGEPLRKIVEKAGGKLPARIATRIVCDACTGAHYAHVAGNDDGTPLVHGDLRPETLLVSFSGVTKVTGYGALAFAPRDMGGQKVGGRRAYSAPEQIIGGREAISVPTDVYLLGLTLYECLTGVVPWVEHADLFDQAVLTHPLPPPAPGLIAPELEAVLQKACAKKAHDRPQTPFALREALEKAAGAELASPDELKAWLAGLFPEQEEARAARRSLIDSGLADFIRHQWAEREKAKAAAAQAPVPPAPAPAALPPPSTSAPTAAAPPSPSVPPAQPPVAPPTGKVAPAVARPPVTAVSSPNLGPVPRTNLMPWLVLGGAIAVFAGLVWGLTREDRPSPGQRMMEELEAARADAGRQAAEARLNAELAPPPPLPDAGAAASTASPAPGPTPEAARPVASSVEASIDSQPPAELSIDGAPAGQTPWSGRLSAGRHAVKLENKELGLFIQRVLSVKGDEPVNERFSFDKGYVAVRAPEGAAVFIDGIKKGYAPITGEIPVFEGSHRIEVRIGQSKWAHAFTLGPKERVSFNVELE